MRLAVVRSPRMSVLEGETAIVTGAGSGIGRAIAQRLAADGATVAVNDVDAEAAAETVSLIEEPNGDALTAVADVTDLESVQAMVEDVVAATGGVDVLVNNAGWDEIEWFLEQESEVWNRIIDVNYRGQVNCARAVGEQMRERGEGGRMVNIASDAGRGGSMGEAVYSGTKGGVIAFSKTLAREFARDGIRVNVVSPGPTETPLVEEMREAGLGEKVLGSMANQIPLGRMAEPEDIAGAVAFMVSPDASFITGQVLSVSGGLTMVD